MLDDVIEFSADSRSERVRDDVLHPSPRRPCFPEVKPVWRPARARLRLEYTHSFVATLVT